MKRQIHFHLDLQNNQLYYSCHNISPNLHHCTLVALVSQVLYIVIFQVYTPGFSS